MEKLNIDNKKRGQDNLGQGQEPSDLDRMHSAVNTFREGADKITKRVVAHEVVEAARDAAKNLAKESNVALGMADIAENTVSVLENNSKEQQRERDGQRWREGRMEMVSLVAIRKESMQNALLFYKDKIANISTFVRYYSGIAGRQYEYLDYQIRKLENGGATYYQDEDREAREGRDTTGYSDFMGYQIYQEGIDQLDGAISHFAEGADIDSNELSSEARSAFYKAKVNGEIDDTRPLKEGEARRILYEFRKNPTGDITKRAEIIKGLDSLGEDYVNAFVRLLVSQDTKPYVPKSNKVEFTHEMGKQEREGLGREIGREINDIGNNIGIGIDNQMLNDESRMILDFAKRKRLLNGANLSKAQAGECIAEFKKYNKKIQEVREANEKAQLPLEPILREKSKLADDFSALEMEINDVASKVKNDKEDVISLRSIEDSKIREMLEDLADLVTRLIIKRHEVVLREKELADLSWFRRYFTSSGRQQSIDLSGRILLHDKGIKGLEKTKLELVELQKEVVRSSRERGVDLDIVDFIKKTVGAVENSGELINYKMDRLVQGVEAEEINSLLGIRE